MVWGQLLWPLVMMQSADMFTFPVGLVGLNSYYETPYGLMSAASVVFTLPLMIVFLLMQRQMIAGLTTGSLKE
jgi:ABC-type glycerol-3-phosphate transport system permease component